MFPKKLPFFLVRKKMASDNSSVTFKQFLSLQIWGSTLPVLSPGFGQVTESQDLGRGKNFRGPLFQIDHLVIAQLGPEDL